jgi:hypothetical protein
MSNLIIIHEIKYKSIADELAEMEAEEELVARAEAADLEVCTVG